MTSPLSPVRKVPYTGAFKFEVFRLPFCFYIHGLSIEPPFPRAELYKLPVVDRSVIHNRKPGSVSTPAIHQRGKVIQGNSNIAIYGSKLRA